MFLDFNMKGNISSDRQPRTRRQPAQSTTYGVSVRKVPAPHTVNDGVRCRWQVEMPRRVVEVQTEVSDLEPRLYVWSAVDVSQREMIEASLGGVGAKARVSKEYTENREGL